jgi:hypothetical protein
LQKDEGGKYIPKGFEQQGIEDPENAGKCDL